MYAGLDIGQATAPLLFGGLMDQGRYRSVIVGLAVVQAVLIASAFNVRRVRREALAPAPPPRRPTRPTRGSQRRRLDAKKRRGQLKSGRGRQGPE